MQHPMPYARCGDVVYVGGCGVGGKRLVEEASLRARPAIQRVFTFLIRQTYLWERSGSGTVIKVNWFNQQVVTALNRFSGSEKRMPVVKRKSCRLRPK